MSQSFTNASFCYYHDCGPFFFFALQPIIHLEAVWVAAGGSPCQGGGLQTSWEAPSLPADSLGTYYTAHLWA